MTVEGSAALPLWLLYEDEIEGWKNAQAAPIATWLGEHQFRGEKHRVLLVPDAHGAALFAIAGLGKRQGELSLWHVSGLPERLPPRRYRLAQDFSAAQATQLYLGFVYGAYRFERYRAAKPERLATLEPPQNADLRVRQRSRARRSAGRAIGSTRPPVTWVPRNSPRWYAHVAARHEAHYREWVGEELLEANFPAIHAVGRASADPPRLAEIRWSPRGGTSGLPRLALIGKGVCFDSGGLDIKPGTGMALMKKDMGGAAVALAARAHADEPRSARRIAGARADRRELDRRQRLPAGRCARHAQGFERRGGQHRCRRAARVVRCVGAGRCGAPRSHHRFRDPDRARRAWL